jgi:hypothetical protein
MVRFVDIYDTTGTKKIGQIKYDPYRPTHKWTAIDKTGGRLKDCVSLSAAEDEVQNASSDDGTAGSLNPYGTMNR